MTANNSTAIARVSNNALALGSQFGYTPEYVGLIKNTIAKEATDDELQMFLAVCHNAKLNPMNKEIYFWKQQGKVIIHTGIQGLRIAAERTGRYAPGKPVKREYDDNGKIVSATAYVQKLVAGTWFEVEETALWSEWSRDTPQWKGQYGKHQLDITAERHALRKAFPQLAGIDSSETMDGSPDGYGAAALPETPEQLNRRHELTDLLLLIGNRICTPAQLNALQSTVGTSALSVLEERFANALEKFREHVASEIGKVHQGDAHAKFVTAMFPKGFENADARELLSTLTALETNASAEAGSETVDGEAVSTEEAERIALAEELMEMISVRADGDLDQIDKILDGRVLPNMSTEQLQAFKAKLTEGDPF